ncbi:MAG: aspartate kinase [Nitrososphaeria archaeon]
MKYVMKFGGTSVKEAGYHKICELLTNFKGDKVVVVVSALKGVTDGLIEATKRAEAGDEKWIIKFLQDLKEIHRSTAKKSMGSIPVSLEERLSKADYELEHMLYGILFLREATPRSIDYVTSFGERYSTEIAAATLAHNNFKSKPFTGGEAGITTNDRFGEATPTMDLTREKIKSTLNPLLDEGVVPVVGGFAGATEDGIVTTMGRGGSDYSATIVANAIEADEVIIWTDVNGIMTADPKIVPEARTLPEISYDEALEMAVVGAKSLHPRALEPVIEKRIPVRIKNTFNPAHDGTLIVSETSKPYPSVVKVVSLINGVGMLTIRGASMVGEAGTAAKFFDRIAKEKINVMMISQSVSESNVSIVVKQKYLQRAHDVIVNDLSKEAKKLEIERDVCVIASVGEGMRGTPGVAARMFKAVADVGVNVRMIAQGSSELNISFVVREEDGVKAVRALHKEFIERV